MGFEGLSTEKFQEALDKRFPKGAHIWVVLGDGRPFTFNVPRVFVLDEKTVLFSPQDDMSIYFDPEVESVEFVGKTEVRVNTTSGRQFIMTPSPSVASEILKDRIKSAFEPGRVERMRADKASEVDVEE